LQQRPKLRLLKRAHPKKLPPNRDAFFDHHIKKTARFQRRAVFFLCFLPRVRLWQNEGDKKARRQSRFFAPVADSFATF
jgi:hypothetical protein